MSGGEVRNGKERVDLIKTHDMYVRNTETVTKKKQYLPLNKNNCPMIRTDSLNKSP